MSQLSRKTTDRENKFPLISDLRDSGALEQDADKIIFIHRKEYYDPHDKPGEAQVSVSKNRHGQTGTCCLFFNGVTSTFDNLSYSQLPNDDPDFDRFSP